MITTTVIRRALRAACVLGLAAAAAGCGIEKQSAPGLSGPSEFGTSLTLVAAPEVLAHDGASQTVVTVHARNAAGAPIAGLGVRWEAIASSSRAMPVNISQTATATDANGRTSIVLTAPPAPSEAPATPDSITVFATPFGDSADAQTPRSVVIRLQPDASVPQRNNNPVAAFTMAPTRAVVNQDVTFSAQGTTDEGEPCLGRCRYMWNFGDFQTAEGITVSHRYPLPQSYSVTLTVVDERGGVGTATQALTVDGPAGPVANFTFTPTSPTSSTPISFNATTSTVGTGATITEYRWDFGAASPPATTTNPGITVTFPAGTYIVTLTVEDNLGREATRTASVVVTP